MAGSSTGGYLRTFVPMKSSASQTSRSCTLNHLVCCYRPNYKCVNITAVLRRFGSQSKPSNRQYVAGKDQLKRAQIHQIHALQSSDDLDEEVGKQETSSTGRETGVVKWFDTGKGYGFIIADSDGASVFVHYSEVAKQGFRSLGPGEPVEFMRKAGWKVGKVSAEDVTGPQGEDVIGEHYTEKVASALRDRLVLMESIPQQDSADQEAFLRLTQELSLLQGKQLSQMLEDLPAERSVAIHETLESCGRVTSFTLTATLRAITSATSIKDANTSPLVCAQGMDFLKSFEGKGLLIESHLAHILMKAKETKEWQCALDALDLMQDEGMESWNRKMWFMAMSVLRYSGRGTEALQMLPRLEEAGVTADTKVCDDVLMALLGSGEVDEAWKFVELRMRSTSGELGLMPGEKSLRSLIRALGDKGRPHTAIKVVEAMQEVGVKPREITYNALVETLCKSGQLSLAEEFLNSLRCSALPCGSPIAYNSLLTSLGAAADLTRAEQVFQELMATPQGPDVVNCTTMLNILGKNKEWDKVDKLLAKMKTLGLKPNLVTYTTLVDCLGKGGEWKRAEEMLEKLQQGPEPGDLAAHNVVLQHLGRCGRVEEVRSGLRGLTRLGLKPDKFSFAALLQAMCRHPRAPRGEQVDEALRHINKAGVTLDGHLWSLLMTAASRSGSTARVRALAKKMHRQGTSKDIQVVNAHIAALGRCGEWEEAEGVWREAKVAGITPDRDTFAARVQALAHGDQGGAAVDLLTGEMQSSGHAPDIKLVTSICLCFIRAEDWSSLKDIQAILDTQSVCVDTAYYVALITALVKGNHWTEVENEVAKLKEAKLKIDANDYSLLITALGVEKTGEWFPSPGS